MYIPGRSRTGSSPFRTVMSLASYATREPSARGWGVGPLFQGKVLVRAPKSNIVILPDGSLRSARKRGVPEPVGGGFSDDPTAHRRGTVRSLAGRSADGQR